jgi:hypothetical protein
VEHWVILHIDMNAFFASVEQAANPELRGKPIAIIGSNGRTVITTASYEARKFGVKTGMAVWEGKAQCQDLILVVGNNRKYTYTSTRIIEMMREKTDNNLENLEWSTRSDNAKHSFDTGLNKNCGETHYKAKLTQEDCRDIIERVDRGERISSIAKDYPVSQPNISMIKHGKTWARFKRLPIIAVNSLPFINERRSKRSRKFDQTLLAA